MCVKLILIFFFFCESKCNGHTLFQQPALPPVRTGVIQVWRAKMQLGAPFFTMFPEGEQKTEAGDTFLDLMKVLDVRKPWQGVEKLVLLFIFRASPCWLWFWGDTGVSSFVGHTRFNTHRVLLLPSAAVIRILAGTSCGQWSLEPLSGTSLHSWAKSHQEEEIFLKLPF